MADDTHAQLIEEVRQLREITDETNRMVRKLDRRARWAAAGVAIKWLIYAGIILGTFVWLQPYLEAVANTYAQAQNFLGSGEVEPGEEGSFADQLRDLFEGL